MEFCKQVGPGGNHLVVATACGRLLGEGRHLKMREKELSGVVEEFRSLPDADRKGSLDDPSHAEPPKRPVPDPPPGGLVVRGYCTYMKASDEGKFERTKRFYYEENPDAWAAETQSDMLWLTEAEWRSLIPADPKPGDRINVAAAIQQRFYSTIGIDYMEGSVNSLPTRDTDMTLTVDRVTPQLIAMRLNGYGCMGKELTADSNKNQRTRGCEVRVLGVVNFNRKVNRIVRFDVVGVGQAWGNKMEYTHREIRGKDYPWMYGIACELVTGDSPIDRIPPYNLLHYGSAGP